MTKPRIAVFDFTSCEGCQLQVLNMEEQLLELLTIVDPVEWREAMSEQSEAYDIAIVEGSITRAEDEERLKAIRENVRILIALGACATIGGVNRLKDLDLLGDVGRRVYGDDADMGQLESAPVKALHEVVEVDYKVEGCPVDAGELMYVIRCLLAGKRPVRPDYPVCVECKMREICCRYAFNEICLGPITRAGCGARCPANGTWCFGCRGLVDHPNVEAAEAVMSEYGKTIDDLKSRMLLFGGNQEITP